MTDPKTRIVGHVYNAWDQFATGVAVPIVGGIVTCRGQTQETAADGAFIIELPEDLAAGQVVTATANVMDHVRETIEITITGGLTSEGVFYLWPISQYGR